MEPHQTQPTEDQKRRRFETVRAGLIKDLYFHLERWPDDEVNLFLPHLPVRLTPSEYDDAFLLALQEITRRMISAKAKRKTATRQAPCSSSAT
jgi:hypothetical protein